MVLDLLALVVGLLAPVQCFLALGRPLLALNPFCLHAQVVCLQFGTFAPSIPRRKTPILISSTF